MGKEILTYLWCAGGFFGGEGVVRHGCVSRVKLTSKRSVLPKAAPHNKGKKATSENLGPNNIFLLTCSVRNAQRYLILYFDMSKPHIPSGRARREPGATGSSVGKRFRHLWGPTGMRVHGCRSAARHHVGRGRDSMKHG